MQSGVSTIVSVLSRHHKILMMAAAAGTELTRLAKRFEAELPLLSLYFAHEVSRMDVNSTYGLIQSLLSGFKLLLERSEALESDLPMLVSVSFSIRFFLVHTLGMCYSIHMDSETIKTIVDSYSLEVLRSASKLSALLCRLPPEEIRVSLYYKSQIRYLQLLLQHFAVLELEGSKGKAIWQLVASCFESLPGESSWSLVLLVSAMNTSRLFGPGPLHYYAHWDVVLTLLSRDLLLSPKQSRSSPTKDPQGPSLGIQDLLQRVKYLSEVWGPPTLDIVSLLTRFFSQRLWSVNDSLQFLDMDDLGQSPNAFDTFLFILSRTVFTQTAVAEDRRVRLALSKSIESFLNILEDLQSSNLHPDMEVPPLLRNAIQFAMAVLPVMSDSDAQNILLERLFSIQLDQQHLSHLSRKIALNGMFKLLATASERKAIATHHQNELQELATIYCHNIGSRHSSPTPSIVKRDEIEEEQHMFRGNPDTDLLPLPGTRRRIVDYLTSSFQTYIVPNYLSIAPNPHAHSSTSTSVLNSSHHTSTLHVHLSLLPSKRPKLLEFDASNSNPNLNAEKLLIVYLKQSLNHVLNCFCSSSVDLISATLGDLVSNLTVSPSIRHFFNLLIKQIIISARNTVLEQHVKAKLDIFWQISAKALQQSTTPPSLPSKVVQLLSELQGMILFAFSASADPKKSWTDLLESGVYASGRGPSSRSIPLHALHSWLDIVSSVLKSNVYSTANIVATDMGVIALSVLINASLESGPISTTLLETLQRAHDLSLLGSRCGKIPSPLELLSHSIDRNLLEMAQRSPPPGVFAKIVISSLLSQRSNPKSQQEFNPYLPILVRHVDDVILNNRTDLMASAPSSSKLGSYDDSIYPFVVFLLKTVPKWLYTRNDVRYNVFGRLASELFIVPIRAMAEPTSAPTSSSSHSTHSSSVSSPSFSSNAYGAAAFGYMGSSNVATSAQMTKASSGMVFGKNRLSKKPSINGSSLPSSSPSSASSYNASSTINDHAIRFLPSLLHSIAQLDFATDADLQRYTCEIITCIFKGFASGENGSHDARLIEQFAAGLTSFQTGSNVDYQPHSEAISASHLQSATVSPTKSDPSTAVQSRIRNFRIFFLANVLPWLKEIIERDTTDAFDTNALVLSRLLSWLLVKLKHASEPPIELVSSFLLSVHYILDLFRARKPTKSALAKKEMLGFFTIFCSTLLKIVPHASPLLWIQSADAHMHDLLVSAFREIIVSITRDLEYISTATWPPSSDGDATMNTSLRLDHVNGLFLRTVDNSVSLSLLTLLDRQGTIEGLKAEAKSLIEVLDFIRQIGAPYLISDIKERIRSILYLPSENMAARHARADIKAALESARKDFGKLSYFISNRPSSTS